MIDVKTEAFDIMQYYYRTAHDPLIHCAVTLDHHVELPALLKAAEALAEQMPVLSCRFDERNLSWYPANLSVEDMVTVVEAKSEDTVKQYLTKSVDIAKGPQLKVFVIQFAVHDVLCLLVNHMVCDGGGFKQCIFRFAELYSQCKEGKLVKVPAEPVRSMKPLFSEMSLSEKLSLLFSKEEHADKIETVSPVMTGERQNPFIVIHKVSKEDFSKIKEKGKKYGATVNDMILTSYLRVLHRETGKLEIEIPCPVDLRKFCRSLKPGLCNLTSNFLCRAAIGENEPFDTTLAAVSRQMRRQKEGRNCLKGPYFLNILSHIVSKKQLYKLFPKLFKIPVVSYTNLGILDFPGDLNSHITDCFMTGAVKYVPYFQVAVSTFNGVCTLSCNMHGTSQDKAKIEQFLMKMDLELKNSCT